MATKPGAKSTAVYTTVHCFLPRATPETNRVQPLSKRLAQEPEHLGKSKLDLAVFFQT